MDQFHRAVTAIEGVERVVALRFEAEHGGGDPFAAPLAFGRYRALAIPRSRAEAGLRLTSRGIDVAFDPAAMRAEFSRLRSRRAMEGARPRDETLWRPRIRGRRRSFAHTRLGEGFPRAFHVGADAPSAALPEEARAAALQLRGYLALADAPLSDAAGDLEALPRLFAVSDDDGASYAARPLDFGPTPELARGTEAAARAAAARHDPWRERKGRALDYLLALRGEAFSQNSLRRFDACRTGEARELRILHNRVRLLREAAALDRDRAAAPDRIAPPDRAAPSAEAAPTEGASASDGAARGKRAAAGAARRIAILLDFPDRGDVALDAVLRGLKLALTEATAPDDPGRVARTSLRAPGNPLDAAPRARAEREPIDAPTLIRDTAVLAGGALPVSAFRRGALIDSYALTEAGAGWAVHLDDGDPETALFCAALASREAAELRANSLALLFETLNASTEGVTLVEDVALRGCVRGFAPLTVHAVFGGVSLRAADPGFRRLAEETARLSLPAHLAVRPRWLGPDEIGRFDALHRAWRAAARRTHAPEGADGAERAAAALAAFLRAEAAP
jgi:hypothetical protein